MTRIRDAISVPIVTLGYDHSNHSWFIPRPKGTLQTPPPVPVAQPSGGSGFKRLLKALLG
jgi:hypothetical protein